MQLLKRKHTVEGIFLFQLHYLAMIEIIFVHLKLFGVIFEKIEFLKSEYTVKIEC